MLAGTGRRGLSGYEALKSPEYWKLGKGSNGLLSSAGWTALWMAQPERKQIWLQKTAEMPFFKHTGHLSPESVVLPHCGEQHTEAIFLVRWEESFFSGKM